MSSLREMIDNGQVTSLYSGGPGSGRYPKGSTMHDVAKSFGYDGQRVLSKPTNGGTHRLTVSRDNDKSWLNSWSHIKPSGVTKSGVGPRELHNYLTKVHSK